MNAYRSPLSRLRAALGTRKAVARSAFPGIGAPAPDGSGACSGGRGHLVFASTTSAALIAMVALLFTSAAPATASENCSNEARREEQGAAGRALPDCRAFELVSPSYMPSPEYRRYFEGVAPLAGTGFVLPEEPWEVPSAQTGVSTAVNGNAALFSSIEPNSVADGESNDLSRRGPNGWVGENIEPPQSRHGFLCLVAGYSGFSQNLEQVVFKDGFSENEGGEPRYIEDCGRDEPRLVPGEPEDSANMFLRDTATGSFQLVNVTPPGAKSYDPWFSAISADGSHVIFQSRALLTPDAPSTEAEGSASEEYCSFEYGDVYVSSGDMVHLLTVLPDGTPIPGTLAGARTGNCGYPPQQSSRFTHSVSADGERILFYGGGGFKFRGPFEYHPRIDAPYVHGGLYLREHPGADQSALNGAGECTEPAKACTIQIDAPEGGSGASGGGQFQWASADTSKIFLTDEEKLTPDSSAETGKPDLYEYDLEKPAGHRLIDLTASAGEPADVIGVSGTSEDGSYVYFVAQGKLASNENSKEASAQIGEANLYLHHAGTTTFISSLDAEGGDRCDWTAYCLTSRVSANGAFIAFDSIDSLTGYDNDPVHPNACKPMTEVPESPCMEAFRYAASSGANGELTCASCNPSGEPPASEFAWSVIEQVGRGGGVGAFSMQLSHNVSNSGQVFFNTMEKLIPTDENGTWDVYQYDGGEGSSAQLHLISSGKSELPSYFDDASPDGNNLFFVTAQALVRSDTRTDMDLYDARVGGGFAEPLVPQCEGESCRATGQIPPTVPTASSTTFSGPEEGHNHPRCAKGLTLRHGKCVSKRPKHHRGPHRKAHHKRGAGK